MSFTIIQTTANPELLRQALELVLKPYSPTNVWSISTAGTLASVLNKTEILLDETQLTAIASFLETTPDFSQAFFVWNGETFTENLPALRTDACSKIDAEAGRTRARYLTSITGQDATYVSKEADCRAYKAAGYPKDTTGFEYVQAEAEATGLTPTQAADATILSADQWKTVNASLEKIRRGGKIDIEKKLKASTIKASLEATLSALQGM